MSFKFIPSLFLVLFLLPQALQAKSSNKKEEEKKNRKEDKKKLNEIPSKILASAIVGGVAVGSIVGNMKKHSNQKKVTRLKTKKRRAKKHWEPTGNQATNKRRILK